MTRLSGMLILSTNNPDLDPSGPFMLFLVIGDTSQYLCAYEIGELRLDQWRQNHIHGGKLARVVEDNNTFTPEKVFRVLNDVPSTHIIEAQVISMTHESRHVPVNPKLMSKTTYKAQAISTPSSADILHASGLLPKVRVLPRVLNVGQNGTRSGMVTHDTNEKLKITFQVEALLKKKKKWYLAELLSFLNDFVGQHRIMGSNLHTDDSGETQADDSQLQQRVSQMMALYLRKDPLEISDILETSDEPEEIPSKSRFQFQHPVKMYGKKVRRAPMKPADMIAGPMIEFLKA
uniref:Uncharacterized protein n=1 Tax=Timema tahoe TaxID=61484 RepID=A0A7R9IRK2_9NEOP|nr:unnamed protein product [Timema tahoe]